MAFRNLRIAMRALALVMACAVAVPAIGMGQLLYFCTMSGDVGPHCGCHHDAHADTIDGPSLTTAPCCELVGAEELVPPIRVEVIAPELETPQFVALPLQSGRHIPVRAPTRLALPHGPRGPPPDTGPPIFIKHCSYLI